MGRFCPPHLGHSHLISSAAAQVDRLVVFVNTRDGEVVPGELRAEWLAELHPDVTVVEVRHDLETDFDDDDLWQRWIALFKARWPLDEGPDVYFSSEAYGAEIARRLGARAVDVDPDRIVVPISASMIRADPARAPGSARAAGARVGRGSLVGLRRQPQVGLDRLPALGELAPWRPRRTPAGTMMTSSPSFQLAGVATCSSAVSCSESITRRISSKLRPVDCRVGDASASPSCRGR